MGYARRSGVHVDRTNIVAHTRSAIGAIQAIVQNFNMVLDPQVQERAYGKPGEPGDVERIVHMAQRFVSVYEEFMDWAAELRGVSAWVSEGSEALRALSDWAVQPVGSCRAFVSDLVEQFDTITERRDADERVDITMSVTLDLDPELSAEFTRKLRQALEADEEDT